MDRQKTSHEKIKEVCTKYGESVMIERSGKEFDKIKVVGWFLDFLIWGMGMG